MEDKNSSQAKATQQKRLPHLALVELFSHLGMGLIICLIHDRLLTKISKHPLPFIGIKTLVNLRLVSKHWRSLVDAMCPKELVIENRNYHMTLLGKQAFITNQRTWFHSGEPIAADSVLRNITDFTKIPFNLSRLRRLAICCNVSNRSPATAKHNTVQIRALARFEQLEHLEISSVKLWGGYTLTMSNLRTLSLISFNGASNRPLIVDAPKLRVLSCWTGLSEVQFVQPETVRELRVHSNDHDLQRFQNVEVLKFNRPASIDPDIVTRLPNLKRLQFEENPFDSTDYERIKFIMDTVLKHKKVTMDELQVFFLDTQLKAPRKFDDYEFFFSKTTIFGTSADHKLEFDQFDDVDGVDNFEGIDDFDGLDEFEELDVLDESDHDFCAL